MFLTLTDFSEGDGGRTWTAEEEEMPPVGEKAGLPGGVSRATPRGGSQQRVLGYVRNDLRYAGTPNLLHLSVYRASEFACSRRND
jgi:hypothetical protein